MRSPVKHSLMRDRRFEKTLNQKFKRVDESCFVKRIAKSVPEKTPTKFRPNLLADNDPEISSALLRPQRVKSSFVFQKRFSTSHKRCSTLVGKLTAFNMHHDLTSITLPSALDNIYCTVEYFESPHMISSAQAGRNFYLFFMEKRVYLLFMKRNLHIYIHVHA